MYSDECLCIIACGKKKRPNSSKAADLYTGTSFIVRRNYASDNFKNWCILSAKYGIVLPSDILEPYDVNMKDLSTEEQNILFTKGIDIIRRKFPQCSKFYLILPAPYDRIKEFLESLGEVIFPLKGLKGRAALHYMITGDSKTVDVDKVLEQLCSKLSPSKGYEKKYLLNEIKKLLPTYSPTYFKRILNSSTIDSTGEKGLKFRRIFEVHNNLYYLADTYVKDNPAIRKKLF